MSEDIRVNAKFTEKDIIDFFENQVENKTGFLKNAIRCYIAFLEANPHIIDSNLKNNNKFDFSNMQNIINSSDSDSFGTNETDEEAPSSDLNDDIPF